jgi:hypothetical protein
MSVLVSDSVIFPGDSSYETSCPMSLFNTSKKYPFHLLNVLPVLI